MAVGFKLEGQDFDDIYVRWLEVPHYEDILGPEYAVPGSLWGSGYNANGELGVGNTLSRSSFTQVGALVTWTKVVAGASAAAGVRSDGSLWTWGENFYGTLGTGNVTYRSSPTRVGALTDWGVVTVGQRAMAAIKTDGTLWTWGQNTNGQLGLGNVTNRSVPFQVGTLNDWKQVAIGADINPGHMLAVKADGTLWAWGLGTSGQLGDGTNTSKSSPIQVGNLSNWKQVAAGRYASHAVKTDGTLWAWGGQSYGDLGLGNSGTAYNSPVQVGTLTNWDSISAGMYFAVAVKKDGTLWGWGLNSYGQIGVGDLVNYSSPVQVGSLATWKQVSAGNLSTMAVRTDGTLWGWGYNNPNGTLGTGDVIHRSSPVQVGSLTSWKSVSLAGGGANFSLAVQY